MSVSLLRRMAGLGLLMLGLSACNHGPSAPPAPANPATTSTVAATATPAPAPAAVPAAAVTFRSQSPDPAVAARENQVAALLGTKYPNLVLEQMSEVDAGGSRLYFMMASNHILYTNPQVDWLLEGGHLIVGVGNQVHDVTADMGRRLATSLYTRLPLAQAMVKVYGKGERQFVMFSDPDCPVCQAFEQAVDKVGPALNAKVYTFAFPVLATHPDSLNKTAFLMCTADPGASWHDWMVHADEGWDKWAAAHTSTPDCDRLKLAAIGSQLAQKLNIVRTPTLLLSNGAVFSGAPTMDQLDQALSQPAPAPMILSVPAATAPSSSSP